MQPVNSQLFYYMLLIYAVGMVAYVALPIKPVVVMAESAAAPTVQITKPIRHATAEPNAADVMTAHPVSLGDKSDAAPLLSAPAIETRPAKTAKDTPQSL